MFEQPTTETMKENIKDRNVWMRLLFMVLFAILYSAAEVVIAVVVVFQFFTLLVTGKKNEKVLAFGGQLAAYVYQGFHFLTFNTERMPCPRDSWPSSDPLVADEEYVAADAEQVVELAEKNTAENPDQGDKPNT